MPTQLFEKPVEHAICNQTSSFVLSAHRCLRVPYHFHPEIEILYVEKGWGTIYIGDYENQLNEGNLFIIGKNLPHGIIDLNVDGCCDQDVHIVTLQFKVDFLGDQLLRNKEFSHIGELLKKSARGLKLTSCSKKYVPLLLPRQFEHGIRALASTIRILDLLGKEANYEVLNSIHFYQKQVDKEEAEKINKIFGYTEQHYNEPISLPQISSFVNFTETSFCRYFKMQTGKNYFQYLNEIRVAHACKILVEENYMDVEEVCFACGFNNPSTFYKQFKKIVKLTPREYQLKGRKRMMLSTMVA